MIAINDNIPIFKTLKDAEVWYETQTEALADVLFNSLPQGILDRLLIALMERKLFVYTKGKPDRGGQKCRFV